MVQRRHGLLRPGLLHEDRVRQVSGTAPDGYAPFLQHQNHQHRETRPSVSWVHLHIDEATIEERSDKLSVGGVDAGELEEVDHPIGVLAIDQKNGGFVPELHGGSVASVNQLYGCQRYGWALA